MTGKIEHPNFVSQTDEAMTEKERVDWFALRANEASKQGATFHRYSINDDYDSLILYEGWRTQPTTDLPKPQFSLTVKRTSIDDR